MTAAHPDPTGQTIGRHLQHRHGYEIAYAVAEAPAVLLAQHERIHETLDVDHAHERRPANALLYDDADRQFENAVDLLDGDPITQALFHALRNYAAHLAGRRDDAFMRAQADKLEPAGEPWQQAAAWGVRSLIAAAVPLQTKGTEGV